MIDAAKYWRTLRFLKPQQTLGRVLYRLRRVSPDLRAAPDVRARAGQWVIPAMRERSLLDNDRWRFLDEEHVVTADWDNPGIAKLWRYNLHYFDDLNAIDAPARTAPHRDVMSRWIAANPPARGSGWEPYPVSLRMVNWIKWFAAGEPPREEWIHSLAVQARWLAVRLETHLLGNHLFVNAKALVFAGVFFKGAEADEWLQTGLRILAREMPEQILPDGGQFELSPMYHALALEDVLDLVNLSNAWAVVPAATRDEWRRLAAKMLAWMRTMTHADRTLAKFNDTAEGIAPASTQLERYAAELDIAAPALAAGTAHLPQSGYVRLAHGLAVALLDVAAVGPDYLPAHAHADTLSFELSLGLQRVLVNGGTSCYEYSAQRRLERGTAAHNTVVVGGADSSEVWGSFRVGRRARIVDLDVADGRVCAAHDGYHFLPGKPIHRRCWALERGSLKVDDIVLPATASVARFLLAPGLRLAGAAGAWQVLRGEETLLRVEVSAGQARAATAHHAPRFGVSLTVDCLEVLLVDGRASSTWSWHV